HRLAIRVERVLRLLLGGLQLASGERVVDRLHHGGEGDVVMLVLEIAADAHADGVAGFLAFVFERAGLIGLRARRQHGRAGQDRQKKCRSDSHNRWFGLCWSSFRYPTFKESRARNRPQREGALTAKDAKSTKGTENENRG